MQYLIVAVKNGDHKVLRSGDARTIAEALMNKAYLVNEEDPWTWTVVAMSEDTYELYKKGEHDAS